MAKPSKHLSNPEKLKILSDLRYKAGLGQEWVAIRFGLTGSTSRLSVSNWENGKHPADEEKRSVFIDYLWFDLGLRRDPGKFREVWDILVEQWLWAPIREEELLREPPFKGLQSYGVDDAALFSGRERLTAQLVAHVRHYPFLAVVGASGSGKSSLVRAGLVSALQSGAPLADGTQPPTGSVHWPFHLITPTDHPLRELAKSLSVDGESLTEEELARDPASLARYVHRRLNRRTAEAQPEGVRLLLVVDQFEELFTECQDNGEQQAFVDNLLTPAILGEQIVVIIVLRADFYARCTEFNLLRIALEQYQRIIGPMSPDELRSAIETPVRNGGWEFEPGLVDLLLQDVGNEPGNLPLLSHALLETWEQREVITLTLAGYTASGRVEGAIATTANQVYNKLNDKQQRIAQRIFLRLTELGEGTLETRHRVERDELVHRDEERPTVEEVLAILAHADARLITISENEVEVAHEALIRGWPKLKDWLREDRDNLLRLRRLNSAAHVWDNLKRDPGALYRGVPLHQMWEWAQAHGDELNELERAFLDASHQEQEREKQEKVDAFQSALEQEAAIAEAHRQRAAVARRLLWIVSAFLTVSVVLMTILFNGFRITQGRTLLQQADQSIGKGEVAQAEANIRAAGRWLLITRDEVAEKIADAHRRIATQWVRDGEALLRDVQGRLVDGQALTADDQQLVEKAHAKFRAALDLKPPPDTLLYIPIPAGEFEIGAGDDNPDADADEKPAQRIYVEEYWVSRTEVTNAQFMLCVAAGECNTPNNRFFQEEFADWPVAGVTMWQARNYARWVGGRLPTEAEWERACRGDQGNRYPWNEKEGVGEPFNPYRTWTEVGSYPSGTSPDGLYDMIGSVGEWTSSLYSQYPYQVVDPLITPNNTDLMVLRGQPFYGHDDCTVRNEYYPGDAPVNAGFRVVFPNLLTMTARPAEQARSTATGRP